MFVPSIPKETPVKLDCNDGISEFKYCPIGEPLAECAVGQLINITDDSVMECEAKCFIDPPRWDEVCRNWKIQEDCAVAREYVYFQSYSPRKHFLNVSECLYFRVDAVKFDGRNSSLMCPQKEHFFETNCTVSCNDTELTELITPEIADKDVSH